MSYIKIRNIFITICIIVATALSIYALILIIQGLKPVEITICAIFWYLTPVFLIFADK